MRKTAFKLWMPPINCQENKHINSEENIHNKLVNKNDDKKNLSNLSAFSYKQYN